ncbi:hypothetical protein [Teredinibacter franksiae]|jgi:hypothetical protein|uniref:hypothetical protein n=1 Tax=Teredinibacter franksiae TaxID=2761453 RepID=UPI001623CC24|nr:hypothetical protein [Teredinibacter franksiae]
MGIEVLDSSSDLNNVILENALEVEETLGSDGVAGVEAHTDARRRLENKIEEMRLLREVREFNFDI